MAVEFVLRLLFIIIQEHPIRNFFFRVELKILTQLQYRLIFKKRFYLCRASIDIGNINHAHPDDVGMKGTHIDLMSCLLCSP